MPFEWVAAACRRRGHLAVGIRRGHAPRLDLATDFEVLRGGVVVMIGPSRMPPITKVD